MSFYTALTGLNAATAQLEITSNNIANVNTSGFKRSRADFGDIFATSPLQKASSVIGQGVALKGVSQEFSQGNIQASANALDLAISGDGFFQLKSADGLQNIYTRNGSFTLNDQYNVVNSAGQALQAASVDSSGKADLSNLDRLTIPKKTAGDAQQTSLVQLGLNFPADAQVITESFNRSNPSTFNKTTALTVYDQGGNSYLATVYYAKTQNASQADPTNKWQTYVFIGDTQVSAALLQATDTNGEKLYVNKYGQLKTESAVADQLVNRKTQMFELDNLNDTRTSVPATVTANAVAAYDLTTLAGLDFTSLSATEKATLTNLFQIKVDGSSTAVTMDLSSLIDVSTADKAAGGTGKLTGVRIAQEMTNVLKSGFGDGRYFDFSSSGNQSFTLQSSIADSPDTNVLTISLTNKFANPKQVTADQAVTEIQAQIDATAGAANAARTAATTASTAATSERTLATAARATANATPTPANVAAATAAETAAATAEAAASAADTAATAAEAVAAAFSDKVMVSYDNVAQCFRFTPAETIGVNIRGSGGSGNDLFGLLASNSPVDSDGGYATSTGGTVVPNGGLIRAAADQRYGMSVEFDSVTQNCTFSSGTTGDASTIELTGTDTGGAMQALATSLLGISADAAANRMMASTTNAIRGIVSQPAVSQGSAIAINVANNFSVDETNNRFVVTVDDVKSTITVPVNSSYTLDGFIAALQQRINQMTNDSGSSVSGVKVEYDRLKNSFKFTSGTTGSDSFIQVSGSSTWGLANVSAGRGTTSTWTHPTQYSELVNGLPVAKYIDARGEETSSADGYTTLPEWSPIYLHKGELTFDTAGTLQSPKTGSQLDTVFLPDGKGALTINIDYSKSTQFSSSFAVLSQSQDGAPEGDLIGVNIADDGLVNASYSNGTQKSLGKIALVNFSNPNGLRQIGDSSYYSSSASGTPKLGEAGAAGFGTVRAGATERANVDLTQELVDLITGQRNFQASAKAIETNTTLTQAIINIRS